MNVIIDRFEGDFAVLELEDKAFVSMPRRLVPPEAGEGTVLNIEINRQETEKRARAIRALKKRLWDV